MSDSAQVNNNKLFVGNMPFSMNEDALRDLFSEYGEIASIHLVMDRMTGRPRGFAFVEYATSEAAQAAIDALNGNEVEGRKLAVNVAKPKAPRENRGYSDNNSYGGGGRGGYRGGGGGGNRQYRD